MKATIDRSYGIPSSVKNIKLSDIMRNEIIYCSCESKQEISSTKDATTNLS